jgi:hypothetical protein
MKTDVEKIMQDYQQRFSNAYDYWIAKDASPSAARDLARSQIEFEDMEYPEWMGSNDSLTLHSYQ